MKKFKFTVSKNQQKYDIVLQANSDIEAKERVHKEGYSILGFEEISDVEIKGHKFLFTIEISGEIKTGAIYGEDIFKSYLKLRKDFGYNIISLFAESDRDKSELEKNDTLKKVKEEYDFYIKNFQNEIEQNKTENEKKIEKEKISSEKNNEEDFYLKKEIEETYKLIEFVLEKIKNVLSNQKYQLGEEKKEKIKFLYNSLVTLKNSRNTSKLKEIGELALLKIGTIELEYLEKNKNDESRKLLKDTNNLLKKIGSKEKFIEKDKDFGLMIKNFFSQFTSKKEEIIVDNNQNFLDKESHSYLKTDILLKKYLEKKRELKKEINLLTYLFPFGKNKEKLEKFSAKKAVIYQNISLFEAKLKGKIFSYTKIVKGFRKTEEFFLNFIKFILKYILLIIYIYSIIFIIFIFIDFLGFTTLEINILGLNLFFKIIIFYLLFSLSRGFFTFAFNFVIFLFLNIFFVVNF